MSKLKVNKINYDDADFLVEVDDLSNSKNKSISKKESKDKKEVPNPQTEKLLQEISQAQLELNRAKQDAREVLEKTQIEVEATMAALEEQKVQIIEEAQKQAQEIIETARENAQKEADELVEKSKQEIEEERIKTINSAYEDGHKDGLEKIQEELEEKVLDFDNFCSNQYLVRDKILKSANKDILDIITNITRKILLKELDVKTIENIIQSTISLLEKKENVTIILSEKYARMLFELQKKSLGEEIEFNFSDFKKYENFDLVYNPNFDDDTIIVENLKERFDASVNSQLDVIIRNIYDNSQNGKIDLENYENEAEWTKWNYK